MNQAQHVWLAIMTELAMERLHRKSALLRRLWCDHLANAWCHKSLLERLERYQ